MQRWYVNVELLILSSALSERFWCRVLAKPRKSSKIAIVLYVKARFHFFDITRYLNVDSVYC